MLTPEIILKARRHIPFVLLVALLTFGVSFFILSNTFISFRSETSFYINENVVLHTGMGHIDPQELTVLSTMATNKVLLLAGSDELRDAIIKDFDLYKHYGINPEEQFAHEKVLLKLNKKISIWREPTSVSLIHLAVEDDDRFVASGIANKVVERINVMNREILQSDLKRRVGQIESVLPQLKDKASVNRMELLSFVDSVSPGINEQRSMTGEIPIRDKIIASNLAGKLDKNSTKYDDMQEQYYSIMSDIKTIDNDEWQCITVVKKALPDVSSKRSGEVFLSIGFGVMAILLYLSVLIYYYQNEDEMNQLWLAIRGKTSGT